MTNVMPKIEIEKLNLSNEEMQIVKHFVKRNGFIKSSKPKVDDANHATGKAAYVWRMIAFQVSKNPVHHCMPVCATFDLPAFDDSGKWSAKIADNMARELKAIENAVMGQISMDQWHGIKRWGKAFGY